MKWTAAAWIAISFAACAGPQGFDRGRLRAEVADQGQVTEADIQAVLELKPQLPDPFVLAIYFGPPMNQGYRGVDWAWSGDDKSILLSGREELIGAGVVSDLIVINDSMLEGAGNRAVRLAAARAGADAVLMVRGAADIDRYNNAIAATYVLLVTAFFMPGTEVDALFMVNASMWDVRNQYLYLGAEAEGSGRDVGSATFVHERQSVREAKSEALTNLKAELTSRLLRMAGDQIDARGPG